MASDPIETQNAWPFTLVLKHILLLFFNALHKLASNACLCFLSHTSSVSSLSKLVFSPRSVYFASAMSCLWGKYSKEETEGYKWPARITTYTHQHPCTPLCVLPPPVHCWHRQAGVAMDDNKIQCWKLHVWWKHRLLLCEIQTKPQSNLGIQLRPLTFHQAQLNFNLPQLSLCPQTWPLISYFTPWPLTNRSWKSSTACCPRSAIWCISLCKVSKK